MSAIELEASVQKAGDNVRVPGQMVDASTSAYVWAERCDRNSHRPLRCRTRLLCWFRRFILPETKACLLKVEPLYPFLKFEAAPAMRKRIRLQELRVGMFVDEVESGSQDGSVRFSPFLVSSPPTFV
ncbi:hypothetical protein [Rhizobium sp. C104]|uniref:hypothetical protein n=1 Tax=Rhizobium sp. C104 TaxID=2917727 RepID=UPI0031F31397